MSAKINWCRIAAASLPDIVRFLRTRKVPVPKPDPMLADDILEILLNISLCTSEGLEHERRLAKQLVQYPDAIRQPSIETRRQLQILFNKARRAHCDGVCSSKSSKTN